MNKFGFRTFVSSKFPLAKGYSQYRLCDVNLLKENGSPISWPYIPRGSSCWVYITSEGSIASRRTSRYVERKFQESRGTSFDRVILDAPINGYWPEIGYCSITFIKPEVPSL